MAKRLTYLSVIEQDKRLFDLAELGLRLSALDYQALFTRLIDAVDETHLDLLADAYHITGREGWDFVQTTEQKRELLKKSVQLHRLRGTPWAVKTLLQQYGLLDKVQMVEWWQPHPIRGREQPPKTVDFVVEAEDAIEFTRVLPSVTFAMPAGTVARVLTYSQVDLPNPLTVAGIGVLRPQIHAQGRTEKHVEAAPRQQIHHGMWAKCLSANYPLQPHRPLPEFGAFLLTRSI